MSELVTSEALLFKGGFGWIVKITPWGASAPRVRPSYSPRTKVTVMVAFFLCAENRCYFILLALPAIILNSQFSILNSISYLCG